MLKILVADSSKTDLAWINYPCYNSYKVDYYLKKMGLTKTINSRLLLKMMTLKCKDMDPSSTCDHMATGMTNEEVMQNMKTHAMVDHADKVGGMTDEQMNDMMRPHIKEETETLI